MGVSRGDARQQGLHLRRWGYNHVYCGEPLWLHHNRIWKEAEADVPREGKKLPVLWGGLRKVRGQDLSAPLG